MTLVQNTTFEQPPPLRERHTSSKLLEDAGVKEALENSKENEVLEVELDAARVYQRSTQPTTSTPIQDFKRFTSLNLKKKASTKPKHLAALGTEIQKAVNSAHVAAGVKVASRSLQKSGTFNSSMRRTPKKGNTPRKGRANNRITNIISSNQKMNFSPAGRAKMDTDDELNQC